MNKATKNRWVSKGLALGVYKEGTLGRAFAEVLEQNPNMQYASAYCQAVFAVRGQIYADWKKASINGEALAYRLADRAQLEVWMDELFAFGEKL